VDFFAGAASSAAIKGSAANKTMITAVTIAVKVFVNFICKSSFPNV
jgi:hypothetical protein